MNSARETYTLYKSFLKQFRPYYNTFFLADLINWIREEEHSFLSAKQINEKWRKHLTLVRNKKASDSLNFYIHIPFCKSKCGYCMYYSNSIKGGQLEDYLNRLIQQINFFKSTFSKVKFSSLYIGGGTPSSLSEKQMRKLFGNLFNSIKFKNNCEKTFECNPGSINLRKFKILKSYGFNRVSFGVQNLDKKVLFYANRECQNDRLIKQVVKNAKISGFEVNTDLMVGLKGDTANSIISSFVKLTKIKPDTITLYPLKPPDEYLKKYFNNNYRLFNVDLYKKTKIVRQALQSMENTLNYCIVDRGFEIYTSSEPVFYSRKFKASYSYEYDFTSPLNFPKPCSLFALGTRGTSYIFKSLQYHDAAAGKETQQFSPNENNYWTMNFDLKDEMVYFILQHLANRYCFSQKQFKAFFNSDFKANFESTIKALEKLGKIKFDGDLVFLPSEGLERFTCALFLLDRRKIIKKIISFLKSRKG